MKIRIRSDARSQYIARTVTGHNAWTDWSWAEVMRVLEGETVEIDTTFLFKTQLNTVSFNQKEIDRLLKKIPDGYRTTEYVERCQKALRMGIRAESWMWDKIEGDIRSTRKLCRRCHHHSDINAEACEHCRETEHFEPLSQRAA